MNDELQKALAEFVKATLAGFQQGKDFVVAQAPEVIQQLIRWNFWLNAIESAICILILFAATIFIPNLIKKVEKESDADGVIAGFRLAILSLAAFVSFLILLPPHSPLGTTLEIYLAPKVWLLEWAMSQVKK